MKHLVLCLLTISIAFNANAQYPYKSDFEFYYEDSLVETTGNYFLAEALILPNNDLFQSSNKSILDSFRNAITAYRKKDLQWLNLNTKGTKNNKKEHTDYFLSKFKKKLYNMHGYAIFHKYSIILLEQKDNKNKLIFALEFDKKTQQYYISADFKKHYPNQFKIIEQAFKGNGEFKIIKGK